MVMKRETIPGFVGKLMTFLILGDGAEELAWAHAIARNPRHRLGAAYPGFEEFPDALRPTDLDGALALADVEAVVVGRGLQSRGESLRRVAAAGLPAICLHPPGDDSEAYYQVALSRAETGAVVIPDLPIRLHPGLKSLHRAIDDSELGEFRGLRLEWSGEPDEFDLARYLFPRLVDGVRALIGEVDAVTATGDRPGPRPTEELIVHLRGSDSRRAEVRIARGPKAPVRMMFNGTSGSLIFDFPANCEGRSKLIRRTSMAPETVTELDPWDPHAAILGALVEAVASREQNIHPNLIDGTRAMELSEATVRSLKRGKTVDLFYEEITEASTFKGVMTSIGCVVLLSILAVLPVALIGPPLGIPETINLAYLIPPVLVLFILLQLLRFVVRSPLEKK
jgi:myo-inositol 2-dehydrogenase/D-chiro-inositol 1-dehydrogenase